MKKDTSLEMMHCIGIEKRCNASSRGDRKETDRTRAGAADFLTKPEGLV